MAMTEESANESFSHDGNSSYYSSYGAINGAISSSEAGGVFDEPTPEELEAAFLKKCHDRIQTGLCLTSAIPCGIIIFLGAAGLLYQAYELIFGEPCNALNTAARCCDNSIPHVFDGIPGPCDNGQHPTLVCEEDIEAFKEACAEAGYDYHIERFGSPVITDITKTAINTVANAAINTVLRLF